jgi:hypothetical protein
MDSPHLPRSLNLPARPISPGSPNRTTQDKLNLKVYAQYPILDQIMLNYLDMDGILELYAQNHETFETQGALNVLTQRFNLPGPFRIFRSLLAAYDRHYPTVRSYHRINKKLSYGEQLKVVKRIILQAALEGNIQAVINGFKLYPGLIRERFLNDVLKQAAIGGHEVIIDLLLELGATNENNEIVVGALDGGHIDLITGAKYQGLNKPINPEDYLTSDYKYSLFQHLSSVKYY